MTLTPLQLYQLALNAGFPDSEAVTAVAVALKESRGDPNAHNTTPPDDSYGLWQINMYGPLAAARIAQFGLTQASDLFDPATNAAAAFAIWAGNDANWSANWYINDGGPNQAAFQSFLPAAQSASSQYAALSSPVAPTGGGGSTATGQPASPFSFFSSSFPSTTAAGVAGGFSWAAFMAMWNGLPPTAQAAILALAGYAVIDAFFD